jgi:Putative addiction module component
MSRNVPEPDAQMQHEAAADDEVEQAWIAEADRRYARYLAGETQSVPAADALARVRARLGQS